MNESIKLGEDQSKWLEKYMSINLYHWRCIIIGQKDYWLYVGEQDEDLDNRVRQGNLERNRYHYWPADVKY